MATWLRTHASITRRGALAGLQLSTELGFSGEPTFGDQDLLGYQASFVRSGASLVGCFEPLSDDLGLDAVVVPEPNQMLVLMGGCACLYLLARRRISV